MQHCRFKPTHQRHYIHPIAVTAVIAATALPQPQRGLWRPHVCNRRPPQRVFGRGRSCTCQHRLSVPSYRFPEPNQMSAPQPEAAPCCSICCESYNHDESCPRVMHYNPKPITLHPSPKVKTLAGVALRPLHLPHVRASRCFNPEPLSTIVQIPNNKSVL